MLKYALFIVIGTLCLTAGAVSAELSLRQPVAEGAVASIEVERPVLSPLSQYQLISDIDLVRYQADDVGAELARLRRRWQGRRYRWRAFVVGSLCARPDSCNVLVTDRLGADKDVVQGWMPRLHMSDSEHRGLVQGCQGQRRCTIRFEGEMSRLELSVDEFTRVEFDDVKILEAGGL